MQRFHPFCHFYCRFKSNQIILGGGFSVQRIKSLISSFKSTNLSHWHQVSVESFTSCSIHQVSIPKTCPSPSVPCNLNLVSHRGLAGLTLAKTPACGSMVYFLWMKDPNESAFLPRLWKEAAGCLVSSCQTSVFDIRRRVKQYTTEGKAKMKHMVKKNINKGPRGWCAVEILQHQQRLHLLWTRGQNKGDQNAEAISAAPINGIFFLFREWQKTVGTSGIHLWLHNTHSLDLLE